MKRYFLSLIPFIIGLVCMVAYNIIGCEVVPDGTLVEPFFLIPMSYLFFAIGIIGLAVNTVSLFLKSKKC
ncbi:MAG: DUF3955 domain-containing protein [Clostridia bacterium]|nr:DUF3955 domain-containing protein [Clostridia bacterium]MDD4047514.1 DUF3955 domain-containing protein [Clostridia bacterium]